jgi:hypothetical protein
LVDHRAIDEEIPASHVCEHACLRRIGSRATRKPVQAVRSASGPHPAGKPAAVAPAAETRLSAAGAFVLNGCFIAGLLILSQLSLREERPTVRAS